MKILHTVHFYAPHVGGSEEVVKQISERLASRGHQVTVATSYDPRRDFTELNGVKVASFRLAGNEANGITGPDAQSYLDLVLNGGFDVVMNYAAQNWSTDLLLPHLDEIPAVKILVPCGYSCLRHHKFRRYYQQLPGYLRQYDRLIYLSPYYQDKLFGDQHQLSHFEIITNAANENEFSHPPLGFRQQYGISTPHLLLSVANFYPSKGQHLLIEVLRRLNRPDVTLALIGNPLEGKNRWRQGYYRKVRWAAWRTPNVRIFEGLPREWVVSAYQEASLFVFGSRLECSPLVILEAMAAGLPFVTFDCGDVRDRAAFGRVVASVDEMASAINDLLDHPGPRVELGRAAQAEWQARYTWDSITDRYEDLYRRLLAVRREGA